MDYTSLAIVVGVVSGVLTAGLLWLLKQIYTNVFTPWLDILLYRGVDISGSWQAVRKIPESNFEMTILMNLKQKAYKIQGTFQAKSIQNETEYLNQYFIKGKIIDNYLIIDYTPLTKTRIGLGNFILRVEHGGTRLRGAASYIAENIDRIVAVDNLEFSRKD